MFSKYVSVILDISIHKTLDYGVPDHLVDQVKKGLRIEVPVRGRIQKGTIFAVKDTCDFERVQPIANLLSDKEFISDSLFELGTFMAKYYCCSLAQVFKTLLPATLRKNSKHKEQLFVMRAKTKEELKSYCEAIRNKYSCQAEILDVMLKVTKGILLSELLEKTGGSKSSVESLKKKGFLSLSFVKIDRSPLLNEEYFKVKPKQLNEEQRIALNSILTSLDGHQFETHLLYGVTGSGKTEVYLQAIERALSQDKGTIMLVPEISLTAQTIERFRSRFEGHIAVLHHALSEGERFDEWHKIQEGKAKIVIGARSAIFSPVKNLGLIIVDEEHDHSYKQTEEAPCYHARDIAVMRGKLQSCTVILGSATPSLESFFNAENKKYRLSTLHLRANSAEMPKIHIVNMADEFKKNQGYTNFSNLLLNGIKKRMEAGEQTILFLNRRGYHTTLFCEPCQQPIKCRHCDVALTFHKQVNVLSCHLCGFNLPPLTFCPSCKTSHPMKYRGVGTEQIEKALHAIFPDVRTIRLDRDTTKHKGSHQKLLREFGSGKADLLIGTQMIAKGLHFPSVTLVGILNSDTGLNIPDFRASENSFQLITQVSGRAGRSEIKGEVIIQTQMPDNMAIQHAQKQDYEKFYEEEIAIRKLFHYPPFSNIAKLTFSGIHEQKIIQAAEKYRLHLIPLLPTDYHIHPVIAAAHVKVKDQFRYQFLIRGQSVYTMSHAIDSLNKTKILPSNIKLLIDINPTSTFF